MNVTILGLTFKPGTDDLRESPSIDMVACLEKDGAIIHAYDPVGTSIAKKVFKDKQIQYCNNPIEACSKSEIIFLLTEWDEFIKIDKTIAFANKYVFDGRNCYSPKDMKMTKAYFSIGRAYQINKK